MLIHVLGATPAAPVAAFTTPPAPMTGATAAGVFMLTPMVMTPSYPALVLVSVANMRLEFAAPLYTMSLVLVVSRPVVRVYGSCERTALEIESSKKIWVTKL